MTTETQAKTDSHEAGAGGGNQESAGKQAESAEKTFVKPGRIVSLDVFRGMTIAGMILVNNSGGPSYGPLDHAEWNGWTHTDLIFPFFMFIAGASMALSMSRRAGSQLSVVSSQEGQNQDQSQKQNLNQKQVPRSARNDNSAGERRKLLWHV